MEYFDDFMDALKRYAEFSGRATRKQFWMYVLIYAAINLVLTLLGLYWLQSIFCLALLIPSLSVGARRLHDTGKSGWWQLIGLIPVLGLIVMIYLLVQESQGDNEYGVSPA
ncbi:MAG: DUF805 domain-containing protein [Gammaproteobacteria bacterium]|nr:DUF805 domain-containing protein [Gammaproteobacteria bacterium]